MHKDLNAISIFVTVAEHGGFNKAAKHLNLTNSVISHHVSKLEEKLGVTLFYRSTRSLSLSDQGRALYAVASNAISDIEHAVSDLKKDGDQLSGSLSITVPIFMPAPRIEELIWAFGKDFPNVSLSLNYSDDRQALIRGGFDLAFRLGALDSSSLIAKKMADIELIFVAAPNFVATVQTTAKPDQFAKLDFVTLTQLGNRFTISKGRVRSSIAFSQSRIEVDSIFASLNVALSGYGIAVLPSSLVKQQLADKKLIRLFEDWAISPIPIYAVCSNKARRHSLVRRLIDYIDDHVDAAN